MKDDELKLEPQEWLSPSSINAYLRCPRCYFYQYVAKIPQPESIHLVKGTIVHEVLENFFKKYDEKLKDKLVNLFDKSVERHSEELRKLELSDEETIFHIKDMKNILDEYFLSFERKMKNLVSSEKAENLQHAFHLLKPKFRELYVKNEDLHVRGYIDRVDKDYNGIVTIGDYKTSKKFGIGFPIDYKHQLSIYALLYKEEFKELPDFASVIFLRYGEEYLLEVTPDLIKGARKLVEEIYEKTRSTNIEDYPITEGSTKFCPYLDIHDGTSDWKKRVRMERLKKKLGKGDKDGLVGDNRNSDDE